MPSGSVAEADPHYSSDGDDPFWPNIATDLAAIRKLLESDTESDLCPSCNMPFDKGKKRKLIDTCGHERCYSCMFRNEACPLCTAEDPDALPAKKASGLRGSNTALYGSSRPQVKTNGHFTSYMQTRNENSQDWASPPSRLPRPSSNVMTQSCPTPPQNRKKFFLSPKSLRSSWGLRGSSRAPADNALSVMFSSTSPAMQDNRRWSSVVLGKIKSLWFTGGMTAMAGLNQLSGNTPVCAYDEGGNIKPVCGVAKKSSQSDLYMRLGLLLGDNARQQRRSRSSNRGARSHDSISSLASLDAGTLASTNTSPVSTLTGSSEADAHRTLKEPSSDSVGSLMSMSGHSNCSSSPLSRRHSVTTTQQGRVEDLSTFRNRRQSIRRSARSGTVKGPIDPKVRFAQYRTQQLTLKPLFFEVPLQEPDPLFVGRHWTVRALEEVVSAAGPGALVTGLPGTGKTALLLQLVDYSCFGRRREPTYKQDVHMYNGKDRPATSPTPPQSIYCQINLVSERIKHLASHVVAYHFCQADNNSTCLVPDLIHSLAAQLCQAPQLAAYKEYLQSEPHLQVSLSLKECIASPDLAWQRGIVEPLCSLRRVGKLVCPRVLILIDALCEAEYHRPDTGDTIAGFLSRHAPSLPPWIKFIVTVRTHLDEVMPPLPFHRISMDIASSNCENVQKDLLDYINFRVSNSPSIQSNVVPGSAGQFRLCQHLAGLAQGSFLFAKLSLDLIERGQLVAKSASYKVLPVSLAQIYLLHFNLRFPTVKSFEKVSSILSVCLAALYPLTLLEIYYSVNALCTNEFLSWDEFLQRFKLLSGLLVKRLDNTYMFFHPSFREWLIRRDDVESNKFICDLRSGHAGIALRLSRLQVPLDAEGTQELGHHILKAHLYKNMTLHKNSSRDLQAHWISSVSADVSEALCTLRNIYSPNVKVSRLLLLSGANADHITEFLGQAPVLCLFSHEGAVEMVALLLEFGASVDHPNSQGCTPLGLAAGRGHIEVVRQLVSAGASLGRSDTAGRCALVHAARNGHLDVVAHLLACDWVVGPGADEVQLREAAQQALVAAAAQGHNEIVEYLLDMSEVVADSQDSLTGETALTVAASNGCHNVCATLLNRGASVSVPNQKGMPALLLAVREGHWAVAERLLQHHAPLDQMDTQGRTPLMMAAAENHVGLLELLLDKGADLSREDAEGLTALGHSCLRGRGQAAQVLLDRGAEVNKADKTGRIPLDLAAAQGNPTLVQMLLERGAMLEHVDMSGMRPLDRAIACRNVPVVQCLLRRGAKLGPTTWTMANNKMDIMLVLLNKLLEDGNVLYRKGRLKEAAHRYSYALNKFPPPETLDTTFSQLRINFLLNNSRCKRKLNEAVEAVDLATSVLKLKPDSYEAYYARAKARIDLRLYEDALCDVQEAILLLPPQNREVRRVLLNLRDEVRAGTLTTSLDTLNQTETSL
ncbi:protein TANC2 isoform X4 [Macrosteles quadrilineatus]|uniref:protein TANC2 isoform X4 n=1 Tax=Macrosteles quadrilineatus TaxID=74068 RepID=UPI0023E29257|nr:protein TANC2 isoform X4 [Macrosteles quadrilineatus]